MSANLLPPLSELVKRKRGCPHCSRGLTMREAAAQIGIAAAAVCRIEQGKLPDARTLIRLCRWLKIDARMLDL